MTQPCHRQYALAQGSLGSVTSGEMVAGSPRAAPPRFHNTHFLQYRISVMHELVKKNERRAYNKLLTRLAQEGHDLSNPVDLKDNWAKHGTNRYITIK
ncbi:unnamed protein product [Rhodiola kirilowii]